MTPTHEEMDRITVRTLSPLEALLLVHPAPWHCQRAKSGNALLMDGRGESSQIHRRV